MLYRRRWEGKPLLSFHFCRNNRTEKGRRKRHFRFLSLLIGGSKGDFHSSSKVPTLETAEIYFENGNMSLPRYDLKVQLKSRFLKLPFNRNMHVNEFRLRLFKVFLYLCWGVATLHLFKKIANSTAMANDRKYNLLYKMVTAAN